ncbi:zinc finger matrin-type protein 1 isoform X2 [Colossoma macropomum]|uniref:zinc finger matrin-type protein 1 isoform X2 n=1 Tax=Colossoma macropomum TaxID=42526 RepID=UPI00186499B8|nr:zinc finger matrin-type protein 1 isoform X2 [Colossoma macropomum]
MSVLEGGAPCETDISDSVNPDSASVSDADTVQNTNAPSCHVEDSQNDSELLKGLLTDTFCQVCEAVLLFESQRVSHYEGKKHAQRVRIYLQSKKAEKSKQGQECGSFPSSKVDPEKVCELCNMVFSSPVVARSHYEGKVHAKNMRKSDTTLSADIRTTAGSVAVPVPAREGTAGVKVDQEQKESTASAAQEVDLSDPDKYCKLCTASFNNPLIAQQHYSGRKHQRNQARQEMLSKLSEESEHASSLTCPVCCVTLSSVETYQAHMQGNKHFVQEKKIVGLCKSQKKVYDSFQDELADYIQVQKARGLEPKRGQGPGQRSAEEGVKEGEQLEEEPPPAPSHLPRPPLPPPLPPTFRPPHWRPPFQPRAGHFGFRGRFPVQHQWGQGYPPHPPPLIPGLAGRPLRRRRSQDSFSSSSSDSSSYTSSSSSSSSSSSDTSSDSSRERRRRRRTRKERMKRRREQDDDSEKEERRRTKRRRRRESEEEGHATTARRQRRMSFEEEQGPDEDKERRKWKEKSHREGDSSEEDEYRSKRRVGKKSKRRKEGHHRKRQKEEDEGEQSKGSVEEGMDKGEGGVPSEGVQATVEEHTEEGTEAKEERPKRKKEKKKAKERMDGGDSRTEEEKLWDETILGIF